MTRVLIIGGARSGSGAALLCIQAGYDVTLVANQSFEQMASLSAQGVHVFLDDRSFPSTGSFDLVIKNPGIPNTHPLVAQSENVINEIELAAHIASKHHIYAISGTNGKTTTTMLLHQMLLKKDPKALCVGNIGTPYSECVALEGNQERLVALEISAFQMEGTPTLHVDTYALMNLTPDHLDRYDSVDAYYKAKVDLGNRARVFFVNADDAHVMTYTQGMNVRGVSMKQAADVMLKNGTVYYQNQGLFEVASLKIVGEHNVMNAMFAAASAFEAGVSPQQIEASVQSFYGAEHRIEFVDEISGVRYYNDSKATNPESTEVCLKAFVAPVILLAGGYDKGISYDLLKDTKTHVKKAVLYGATKHALKAIYPDAYLVETLEEAVSFAHDIARTGDTVVLSPASASYDQFSDFEARGRAFKKVVKSYR